jgi:hypothetical protein
MVNARGITESLLASDESFSSLYCCQIKLYSLRSFLFVAV